ncbi:hypothetical protein GCM10029992_33990 [Glycomyces albus]
MAHTPYIARVILGRRLQEYRERAGFTVAEAWRKSGISDTKIRKLERGVNDAIRLADVYAFSAIYQCNSTETAHLIELAEGADSHGWYHGYDVPAEFAHFIEQEGAASAIHIFELEFVHGLFQTEDYLDQLRTNRPRQGDEPDRGLRSERQENVLGRDNPAQIIYVSSEAALRRQVGGPEVMRAQVKRLIDLGERRTSRFTSSRSPPVRISPCRGLLDLVLRRRGLPDYGLSRIAPRKPLRRGGRHRAPPRRGVRGDTAEGRTD